MKFYIKKCLILLSVGALLIINTAHAESVCKAFPYFKPESGPLAYVNCDFHAEYEKRVVEMVNTFGAVGGRPVIMNLGGTLIFKYAGKTETVDINPMPLHDVKTYAHAAFSLYFTLAMSKPGSLSIETRNALIKMNSDLDEAIKILPLLKLDQEAFQDSEALGNATHAFLNKVISQNAYTSREIKNYFNHVRPMILASAKKAAAIELHELDKAVTRWTMLMTEKDKKQLGVVVATVHQARAKETSLQYFAKKFGFKYGEGALNENSIVVLEGKFDEDSALKLLARHYLDRDAAAMIFHEPARLQRDLLGDGAAEVLAGK